MSVDIDVSDERSYRDVQVSRFVRLDGRYRVRCDARADRRAGRACLRRWTYLSSGSPSSSPGPDIQLTWNDVSPGNPPQYEVFTLPVSFDPNSVWCATQDGHDAGVIVGQPDGNPNEFECNFGAYPSSGAGAAGVTTTTPMPCDAMIQQKFSWDGSTFYPWDDLTPTDCGGGSSPPGSGSGPPGSGGSRLPR